MARPADAKAGPGALLGALSREFSGLEGPIARSGMGQDAFLTSPRALRLL